MLGFFPRVLKGDRVSDCCSLVFKNCGMLEYPGSQRAFLPPATETRVRTNPTSAVCARRLHQPTLHIIVAPH